MLDNYFLGDRYFGISTHISSLKKILKYFFMKNFEENKLESIFVLLVAEQC